jgi:hypothetical protein
MKSPPGLRLPKPTIKATFAVKAQFASYDASECEADARAFQAEVEKVIAKFKAKSKVKFEDSLTIKN